MKIAIIIYLIFVYFLFQYMNYDLCSRNLTPLEYQKMQLDCSVYNSRGAE